MNRKVISGANNHSVQVRAPPCEEGIPDKQMLKQVNRNHTSTDEDFAIKCR